MTQQLLCPYCGHDHIKVLDTRPVGPDFTELRRRRACRGCDRRWTTYETVADEREDGRAISKRKEAERGLLADWHSLGQVNRKIVRHLARSLVMSEQLSAIKEKMDAKDEEGRAQGNSGHLHVPGRTE